MIEVDGLNDLIVDLTRSPIRVQAKAAKAAAEAAKKGAEDARRIAPTRFVPGYASTITAEAGWAEGGAFGEFGPEARGQGNLGQILEEGSPTSPPHAHIGPAFDRQGADFLKVLGDIEPL